MKGERGNNQRSQYFTLDTDACSYAADRRDLLAAQLSSDLTLRFNATFLSPAHSSRFLSHSPGAPALSPPPTTYLCPLSLLVWLQWKGKCSSGEVRYLRHKVLRPTMWPGPPNILLLLFSSSSSLPFLHNRSLYLYPPQWPHPERLIERTSQSEHLLRQIVQKFACSAELTCWQMQGINMALLYTQKQMIWN